MSANIGPIQVDFRSQGGAGKPFLYRCLVTRPLSSRQQPDVVNAIAKAASQMGEKVARIGDLIGVNAATTVDLCTKIGFFKEETAQARLQSDKCLVDKIRTLIASLIVGNLELHEAVPRFISLGLAQGKLAGRILKSDAEIDRMLLTFTFGDSIKDGAVLPYLRLEEKQWVDLLVKEYQQGDKSGIAVGNKRMLELVAEVHDLQDITPTPGSPVVPPKEVVTPPPIVLPTPQSEVITPPSTTSPPVKPPVIAPTQPKQSVWASLWSGVGAVFHFMANLLKGVFRLIFG